MRALCRRAYDTFDHPAVAPLSQIDEGRFLLSLFHGPTLAFKDVAMQLLARLYEHGLAARHETLTIVCATSGDTGGAAVEAFAGRENIRLVALFPEGRISGVQRRFMTTSAANNIRCVSVAGDFDDCQALLKGLFAEPDFAAEIGLAAVNSINIARVIAQSVYYFTSAVALGAPHREIDFVVPTGNFGDAYAGWAARRMGLPIGHITVATNVNDILARALDTGVYRRGRAVATQSPAMDIQVASNFERLLYDCSGEDGPATDRAFAAFAQSGELTLPGETWTRMRERFTGVAVSEAETDAAMSWALASAGLAIDPHTAVALSASRSAPGASPQVVLATAHPAKFPDAAEGATGHAVPPPPAVIERASLAERIDPLAADASALKSYLRAFVAATP